DLRADPTLLRAAGALVRAGHAVLRAARPLVRAARPLVRAAGALVRTGHAVLRPARPLVCAARAGIPRGACARVLAAGTLLGTQPLRGLGGVRGRRAAVVRRRRRPASMSDALADIRNFLALDADLGTAGQPTEEQYPAIAAAGYRTVVNLALPTSPGALP